MAPDSLSLSFVAALLLATGAAAAAPEARILRIVDEGTTVTTLVELVQNKRIADVTSRCATLSGDANLDCVGSALEQPGALYSSFDFPEKNALFTVAVNGGDVATTFTAKARWAESAGQPAVGTAWLVLVDAAASMGARFDEGREVARAFVNNLAPGDVADVMFFNDRGVTLDSKWVATRAEATAALGGATRPYPAQGRSRPLFTLLKQAATDGFTELRNPGGVTVPMHQAMVVISSGWSGADAGTTAGSASVLKDYLSRGRFPEGGDVQRTPVPVISIWLPGKMTEEHATRAREFMEGIANPEIGGFFTVLRQGQASRAQGIVGAVRTRFGKMHLVRWRAPCAARATQTYKLMFTGTLPPIAGDATFAGVPVGPRAPCRP